MWGLVLAATLGAESVHAAGPALPGSRLRLGQSLAAVDSALGMHGGPADSTGRAQRKTNLRFFGLESQATLGFEGGGLATAAFEVASASPHSIDYIADQMRRAGYAGNCVERAGRTCNWDGPTRVQLVAKGSRLTARVRASSSNDVDDDTAPDSTGAGETLPSSFSMPEGGVRELIERHAAMLKHPNPVAPSTAAPTNPSTTVTPRPAQERLPIVQTPPDSDAARPAPPAVTPPPKPAPAVAAFPTLRDTLRMPGAGDPNPRVGPYPVPTRRPPIAMVSYPQAAREAGVQGVVRVLAFVDTAGVVTEVSLVRGIPELNAEALRAARLQRFEPYRFGGVVYGFRVIIPYRFTIH